MLSAEQRLRVRELSPIRLESLGYLVRAYAKVTLHAIALFSLAITLFDLLEPRLAVQRPAIQYRRRAALANQRLDPMIEHVS